MAWIDLCRCFDGGVDFPVTHPQLSAVASGKMSGGAAICKKCVTREEPVTDKDARAARRMAGRDQKTNGYSAPGEGKVVFRDGQIRRRNPHCIFRSIGGEIQAWIRESGRTLRRANQPGTGALAQPIRTGNMVKMLMRQQNEIQHQTTVLQCLENGIRGGKPWINDYRPPGIRLNDQIGTGFVLRMHKGRDLQDHAGASTIPMGTAGLPKTFVRERTRLSTTLPAPTTALAPM